MTHRYFIDGFTIVPRIISPELAQTAQAQIQKGITFCANDLNFSKEDYLKSVSRWVSPSPVTNGIKDLPVHYIQPAIESLFDKRMHLIKTNVIYKSLHSPEAIACHQDIAYSKEKPYELSVWVALNDVTADSGALEVLPGSHLKGIQPAVDFWQSNFIDHKRKSREWQQGAIAVPLKQGDALVFDSRIWHGSGINRLGRNRFALVSRFTSEGFTIEEEIPDKIPAAFGMWTCSTVTHDLLKKGLRFFYHLDDEYSYQEMIDHWLKKLKSDKAPFECDQEKAILALYSLKILDAAAGRHNGGDAQGKVYPNLWNALLRFIEL